MTAFENLNVSIDGAIGNIQLNRPDRLNALSYAALRELAEAAAWFDQHPSVKVVSLSGAGRAFCAGFDLADFVEPEPNHPIEDLVDLGRVMADAITNMRAITIVGIHGRCVGGGLVLAAACDLRLAATDTVFSIPEANLGIPLGWGGIPRLVREIGPALTKELVLTCREFDAHEAATFGFLNRVVAADELAASVADMASLMAMRSALTLTTTKNHVNAVSDELATTANSRADAVSMVAALNDPESRAVGAAYLDSFSGS